jgi:4-aminobutyrate aminotransferase
MPVLNLPGPKARALIKRDEHVISPSYPRGYPFVMDHGRGTEVWDVDGNRFLDFMAGIAVTSTGHSHPQVVKAIQEQVEKFIHISSDFYHENWVKLAEKLDEIAPFKGNAISFMSNSGAEAVESALKMARQYTRKTDFIGFLGGFHGRTMGAVTFTASKSNYHRNFHPLMSGVTHVPFPDPYRQILATRPGEDYGAAVVRYIEEQVLGRLVHPDNLAGILVEPIQGEGGYVVPTPGFFPALRQLCDKHNILLIADEVQSGMGRSGKWWAIENFGVEPDIVCSAKGIASGMPLGVTFAKQHIVNWPRGSHGNTYGGNPVSCVAALQTIDLVEKLYLDNANEMGAYLMGVLEQMQARHPSIGQVRGKGLMIGVEFVKDRMTKEADEKVRDYTVDHAFYRGLLLLGCAKSVIRLAPPLCVTKAEIDEAMAIFDEALTLAEQGVEPKETSEGEAVAA